jgi:hypothetical protein
MKDNLNYAMGALHPDDWIWIKVRWATYKHSRKPKVCLFAAELKRQWMECQTFFFLFIMNLPRWNYDERGSEESSYLSLKRVYL